MAKVFLCGDVVDGCAAQFTGDYEGSILAQVADHARQDHGMETVPPDVVELVRARIRSRIDGPPGAA